MLLLCSIVLACLHEEEPVSDGDPVGDAVDGGGVDGHVGAGAEGALAQGPRADGEEAVEQPQAGYQALAGREADFDWAHEGTFDYTLFLEEIQLFLDCLEHF